MEPFKLIAGPCVIENKQLVLDIAKEVKSICQSLGIKYTFKASFDKANRSSGNSFRGPGMKDGLEILNSVKESLNVDLLTDIHESNQAKEIAKVVDIIQIPAFLCRQTDLLLSVVKSIKDTNKIINIKKGQFLAPWDMKQVVNKIIEAGIDPSSKRIWLTERGTTFGYNNLVVDFRSLPQLQSFGCPVIFDATHSVQQPGGQGEMSGGQREFVSALSRAAVAIGADGLFLEVHPEPNKALSDGPNMVPLHRLKPLLTQLISIRSSLGDKLEPSSI